MHTDRRVKKTIEEIIGMTPEEICSDREIFDELIYTDIDTAMKELQVRINDPDLKKHVDTLTHSNIPKPFEMGPRSVLLRHLITPNYETLRFENIVEMIDTTKPLFLEFTHNKFIPSNQEKKMLGSLNFFCGRGSKNDIILKKKNIIDFEKAQNKFIDEIYTIYNNVKLVDFHHELLKKSTINKKTECIELFDVSKWYHEQGGVAKDYYIPMLALFLRNGILFENFMLNKDEENLVKNIVIPSVVKIIKITGKKPLIVPLALTEIEGDKFWGSYPTYFEEMIK